MDPSCDPSAWPSPGPARRAALAEPTVGPVLISWLEVLVAEGLILGVPRGWRGCPVGESAPEP